MRVWLIAILGVFALHGTAGWPEKITKDPNAPGTRVEKAQPLPTDPRLAQKVTYSAKLKPMAELADDMTQLTGVKFLAGRSNADWVVREDRANVFAKDLPLISLMDSIAHVMKCKWVKSGEAPNWTYRIVEDPEAIRRVKGIEAAWRRDAAQRKRWIYDHVISKSVYSDAEMARIRSDYPELYPAAKSGVAGSVGKLMREVPEVREAWFGDRELELKLADLPPASQAVVMDALERCMRLRASLIGQSDGSLAGSLEHVRSDPKLRLTVTPGSRGFPLGSVRCGYHSLLANEWVMGNSASRATPLLKELTQLFVRAYDEKLHYFSLVDELRKQHAEEFENLERNGYSWPTINDTDEDYLDPSGDPLMRQKLKEKIEAGGIPNALKQLSQSLEMTVVSDDFPGAYEILVLAKGDSFRKVDDWIADLHRNWRSSGQTLEIWNRNWYEDRLDRLPQAWLKALRERYRKNGTLDLDDLAAIAALKNGQYNRNIASDRELCHAGVSALRQREGLKFYASLDSQQRTMLFSEGGLSVSALGESQMQAALKLQSANRSPIVRAFALSSLGLRVSARRLQEGKIITYVLTAASNLGPLPGDYRFQTPIYYKAPDPDETRE